MCVWGGADGGRGGESIVGGDSFNVFVSKKSNKFKDYFSFNLKMDLVLIF